jgi:hypothetical protein
MQKILTDAVAIGNATARAIDFRGRDPASKIYPDRHWNTPFIGGRYQWLTQGARNFDARTMYLLRGDHQHARDGGRHARHRLAIRIGQS